MTGPDSEPHRPSAQPTPETDRHEDVRRDLPVETERDSVPDARDGEASGLSRSHSDDGPPGAGIFSLEGRRAPGLYLVAWLLTVAGLAVTFILGPMASDPDWRPALVFLGAFAVTVGLAAGAGAQILERASRTPERYRGPAPVLVFGVYFFAMSMVGLVLLSVMGVDPERPFNFLGIGVVQAAGYVLAVWLFGIRSGALTWPQMGWPTWAGTSSANVLRAIAAAVALMLPVTMAVLVVGGIAGLLLCSEVPRVLPLSETFADGVFVVLAAAIIIPVGEEVFFRGFVQTAWTRDLGPRKALLLTTAFFALVHVVNIDTVTFREGIAQAALTLVVIAPVGYVLGWLFGRYGLIAAIGGHVSYNSLLLALAYVASRVPEPTEAPLQGWCQ